MPRFCLLKAIAILFVTLLAPRLSAAPPPDLRAQVEAIMEAHHIPGLQAVVRRADGSPLADLALGIRDADTSAPVTSETIYMAASLSKPVTMMAVLAATDDGLFTLDSDVQEILGLPFRNPSFPEAPITIRHLLAHTSGVRDGLTILDYSAGDYPLPLTAFLAEYFTEGGSFYPADKPFLAARPGAVWEYSNVGFAVLAAAVEAASGQTFPDYCRSRLFARADAPATEWLLSRIETVDRAIPMFRDVDSQSYVSFGGEYGMPHWPAACLRTTATDYALLANLFLNEGRGASGDSVLRPEIVLTATAPAFPEASPSQALSWQTAVNELGESFLYHAGAEAGYRSVVVVNTTRRWTVVILTGQNARQWGEDTGVFEVLTLLEAHARSQQSSAVEGWMVY